MIGFLLGPFKGWLLEWFSAFLKDSGFRVLGFRVFRFLRAFGFRIQGLGFSGFGVFFSASSGFFGFRNQGLGFRVLGFRAFCFRAFGFKS